MFLLVNSITHKNRHTCNNRKYLKKQTTIIDKKYVDFTDNDETFLLLYMI